MTVDKQMSKDNRDRISIEVADFRDRVAKAYDTHQWNELAFSAQLRVLILERLDEIEKQRKNVDSSEPERENEGSDDR
jgi:hypothetical protein